MENRIIKIELKEQDITVTVDDEITLRIDKNLKVGLNGLDIFDSLDFNVGDRYELRGLSIDETNASYRAIKLFYDFYNSIIEKINEIDVSDEKNRNISLS